MPNQETVNLINGLSEENFKTLVKRFVKEYYQSSDVRITDGPYDGGNDLEIFVDGKEIKKNIQITVQKSDFETKLIEDLKKANSNVEKYNYLNKLDFYISRSLTKAKRNELIRNAELNYNIDLKIFDSNTLAELSEEFKSILESISDAYAPILREPAIKIDKKQKITYDYIASSNESSSIKKQFIYSYILSFIYENPGSTVENIHSGLSEIFSGEFDIAFFLTQLNILKGKGDLITPIDKTKYELSQTTHEEIKKIFDQTNALEGLLKNTIEDFLIKNGIHNKSDELINILFEAYKENYKVDIDEITLATSSFQSSIRKVYTQVIRFFKTNNLSEEKAKSLTKELLVICSNSDYLNKLGVSLMFTNLFKSDKLEKYLNTSIQDIFIDTQILLCILCVKYAPKDFESDDIAIKSVREFLSTVEKFNSNVYLNTFNDYIDEVVGHLLEALKLQRFLELPYISRFGPSKNVFYNFYIELLNKGVIENIRFEDFIKQFISNELPQFNDPSFRAIAYRKIRDLFEFLDFQIVGHPLYSNYSEVRKEYEYVLMSLEKDRSFSAREHDLKTILYLSTPDFHRESEYSLVTEPYLITWDSAFYSFRKGLSNKFPDFSYWYIYSPLKYADKLSVTNFQINPKTINYNVIALAESNFNYSTKTTSFFDLISSLFNKQDIGDLNLIRKLVDLKDRTQSIEIESETPDFKEPKSPITEILIDLRDYYYKPSSKFKILDFTSLLENKEFENEIIITFERNIELFLNKFKSSESLFKDFDILIEKSISV